MEFIRKLLPELPTAAEQAVCAPFVERAFALLKPKAVLLLGFATSVVPS